MPSSFPPTWLRSPTCTSSPPSAADHQRLDMLVNNAGIGSASGAERRISKDGHD